MEGTVFNFKAGTDQTVSNSCFFGWKPDIDETEQQILRDHKNGVVYENQGKYKSWASTYRPNVYLTNNTAALELEVENIVLWLNNK